MSKSRNRNLKNFNYDFPRNLPQIKNEIMTPRSKDLSPIYCFGECVPNFKSNSLSFKHFEELNLGSTDESDILNLSDDNGSFDKSCSSSSLSWAEEYEEGYTKKVEDELRRMENILQLKEPIPSRYDADEYELWIQTFPTARLLGKQDKHIRRHSKSVTILEIPGNPSSNSSDNSIKIISLACDNKSTSYNISKTVIGDACGSGSYFAEQKESTIKRKKAKQKMEKAHRDMHETKSLNSLETQFENVLKISRAPVFDSSSRLLESRLSSNVIARSQVSASKWLRSDSPEFISMPYLTVEQCSPRQVREYSAASAKGKLRQDAKKKSAGAVNKFRNSKVSPRTNYVTLPPIKHTNSTTNQYRSISATPRQQSKSSSALSVKSVLGNRKYRLEIESCLFTNEGSQTRSTLHSRLQNGNTRKM